MTNMEHIEQLAAAATVENIDETMNVVERFPDWYQVHFVRLALGRDNSIVNTSRIGDWCRNIMPTMLELIGYGQ